MDRFVIVLMADGSTHNVEVRKPSVLEAEAYLRRHGYRHQWGMSWVCQSSVSPLVQVRALIADRGLHVPMRRVVSLHKRGA